MISCSDFPALGNEPYGSFVSRWGYTEKHDLMPKFTLMSKCEFVASADCSLQAGVAKGQI